MRTRRGGCLARDAEQLVLQPRPCRAQATLLDLTLLLHLEPVPFTLQRRHARGRPVQSDDWHSLDVRERGLETLRVLNASIISITRFLISLTPIGVFATGAAAACTMTPDTFVRLGSTSSPSVPQRCRWPSSFCHFW
jgi:hypothetical protein